MIIKKGRKNIRYYVKYLERVLFDFNIYNDNPLFVEEK